MVQIRNSNKVMESENHFKNGASSKSQTSRGFCFKMLFLIIVFCMVANKFVWSTNCRVD